MYCVSIPIVFICMVGAFYIMILQFWLEEYLKEVEPSWISSIPGIVYSILVYIMNFYYRNLATFLTEWGKILLILGLYKNIINIFPQNCYPSLTRMSGQKLINYIFQENHRTQSQYDRHRVSKLVLLEFVNNFMSLFYIAFIVQDMEMLANQLLTMLIILQILQNVQEAILPLFIKCYSQKVGFTVKWLTINVVAMKKFQMNLLKNYIITKSKLSRVYKQMPKFSEAKKLNLLKNVREIPLDDLRIEAARKEGELEEYEGTYDDFLEMFIQFGYVLLFSSVYPIAAFWALLNNVLEIKSDAFKLCMVYQRPMSRRVKDIGAWQVSY